MKPSMPTSMMIIHYHNMLMSKLIPNSSMMRMKLQLTEKLDLKDTTQKEQLLLAMLLTTTTSLSMVLCLFSNNKS